MDLFLDLIEFMLIRAQRRGFETTAQAQRYNAICAKIVQLHPQAAQPLAPAQPPAPAPAPAPAPSASETDWGTL